MKLLLLGATGRTGRELLVQGLDQGHEITALARDPSKVTVRHERLRTVTGRATDPTDVDTAVEGQDAVLCALGPRSAKALVSCDLMRASMRALVPAMERRRVRRLVLLSALGAGRSSDTAPAPLRYAFRTLFRQVGKDKADAEEYVRNSELEWTIVYPPTLTDGPRTATWRDGETLALKGMPKISRADVADFMLAQLTDTRYRRKPAVVSI